MSWVISKKRFLGVILGVLILGFFFWERGSEKSSVDDVSSQEMVVRLAHVGPITGPIAHIGKDTERGAMLAIHELNKQGLVIGGKKIEFRLLTENDGGDPKQATTVAQKLVDSDVSGVIGHLQSGTTIPASKIYHDAGIPQISAGATNPKYTQQEFNTTFRVTANDAQLGGRLGTYAVETLHAKKIAVIDDRTAYGQGLVDEFIRSARKAGAIIVSQEYTNDRATDFKAILTKIKAQSPDVIFLGGLDATAGPMLRQIQELKFKHVAFMGGDAICTEKLPSLAGDLLNDISVICAEAGGVESSGKAALDAYKDRFKHFYAGEEVILYAPYAYDAVMVIAKAMQMQDSVDFREYVKALAKIHHKGVTGTIAFDKFGDMQDAILTLYTFKDGKRTLVAVTK